jgi:hypothetical protein
MRITDLNTLVTASLSDILYIVDVSDTGDFISGSSKQITVGNFFSSSNVGGGGGGGGSGGSGYLVLTSSVVSSSVNIDSTVFTSNGVQTAYNVSGSVTEVADDVIVFINGVSQIPNVNYTLSSSILTFSGTPSSGSKIDVRRASSVLSVTFITSSMGVEYFTGNNSSSQFTLTNGQTVLHNYDVLISLDGLIQKPTTDYSITGSILNFTVPPPINTDVEVRYLSPQTFTLITGSGGSGGGSGAGFPFSGSAVITGSLLVTNYISGSFTGSLLGTSSYALTASNANNTVSSSYSLTSSYTFTALSSSYAFTTSNANNALSSSYTLSSSYALTSSYSFNSNSASYANESNNSNNSIYAITASYALTTSGSGGGGGGSGAGFPFSGSAVITGSLNVSQTITLNNTVISASGNTLYINGSPISILQFAYFSASISSSTETGILNVRNDLLQGKSLLNGDIYVNNLSTASNATLNVYNASTSVLFQTETILPSQNLILNLTDFIPLKLSGSGYFTFQITASVV